MKVARHFVSARRVGPFRRYVVFATLVSERPIPRTGRKAITLAYREVSVHWTRAAAEKACRRRNREIGYTP